MTTAVTKESLAARIADLEYGPRSLKEDYTLAAYKMLLATMDSEPVAWMATYHGEVSDDAIGITRSIVEAQAERFGWEQALTEITPLYRHAQPAPGGNTELLRLREAYAELQERYDLDVNPDGK